MKNALGHSNISVGTVSDSESVAVKSAARAFQVIEFIDEIRRPARAKEIASALQLPQSSSSVLLKSLVYLGYLDYDSDARTYLPSLRTTMIASWRDTGCLRDGAIRGLLESVTERTGYSCGLASRDGIYVRYLKRVLRPQDISLAQSTLTSRLYTAWSAIGAVLLTDASEHEVHTLVYGTRAQRHPGVERICVNAVFDHIAVAREQGYFVSRGLVMPEAGTISIKLPKSITGEWLNLALCVFGRRSDVESDEPRLVKSMRETIHSVEMGCL